MLLGLRQVCSIGDLLFLTPVIHVLRGRGESVKVQLHDDEQGRSIACLLDGLAEVEHVPWPEERLYILNKEKIHSAKRALHQLGFYNYSCIPKINLTQEELDWGQDYVSQFKNPIIIYRNNSGDLDPINYRAHYVAGPRENMQLMTDYCISQGYTVLQFGHTREIVGSGAKSFTPLDGAVHIRNINIRQQACCLAAVKKIIGIDSGLYHLMLSVGGKAVTSIPDENFTLGYEYWDLLYPESEFEGPVRVKYINHRDFLNNKENILSYLNT